MSTQHSALSSQQPTPGEWKSEVIGTGSARWIRIYVDNDRYEDGFELFESATVQTSYGVTKRYWRDTRDAAEIRVNVALVLAARDMLAALKAIRGSCPTDRDVTPEFNQAWDMMDAAIAKGERRK